MTIINEDYVTIANNSKCIEHHRRRYRVTRNLNYRNLDGRCLDAGSLAGENLGGNNRNKAWHSIR